MDWDNLRTEFDRSDYELINVKKDTDNSGLDGIQDKLEWMREIREYLKGTKELIDVSTE